MHLTSKCRINSSLMMLLLLTSSIGAQIGNAATFEKLKTAPVFGTGMVLQCGEPIRIWGTSAVGDKISVTLGAQNRGVTTSTDGNWSVVFPPKKASFEPLALTVNEIQFDDILIGEVWICAGQSNMQFSLKQCDSGNEMLRRADNPHLRIMRHQGLRLVAKDGYTERELQRCNPVDFFETEWLKSDSKSAATASAVGWIFAEQLQKKLNVPVGLIQIAVGGSAMNNWIPPQAARENSITAALYQGDWLNNEAVYRAHRTRAKQAMKPSLETNQPYIIGETQYRWLCEPGFLFEAGIAPLQFLSFRGVLWYQGESDAYSDTAANNAAQLFPFLIESWRKHFNQCELPFLFVQLPGFKNPDWPAFRESQRRTELSIPDTGMVVAIDLGDEQNIHPKDKRPIGDRLLRLALNNVYEIGGETERLGFPTVNNIQLLENRLVIKFENCGDGFLPIEGKLNGFEIGDEAGDFMAVDAELSAPNSVTLHYRKQKPSTVRYLWEGFPENKVKLFNEGGLPAGPFSLSVSEFSPGSTFRNNHLRIPPIVAHRGASAAAPENTIPAFELAWEKGADAIELDCHLTADGYIVCIHDKDTKKVADQNLVIRESKLEDLRALDVGSWLDTKFAGTTIPTLVEAMATVPAGKKIYIEVKCNASIVPVLFQDIEQADLSKDQIVIISFDAEVIRQVELKDPLLQTYWLTSLKKEKSGALSPTLDTILETLSRTGTDGVSTNHAELCSDLIRSVQKAGYQHHVWTVDQPQTAAKLWRWGTESITTNRPEKIRQHFQVETSVSKGKKPNPNILLIVADDLGWADVGYHGSPIPTPNIDHLCKTGIELDRHYVAPMCTPTRVGLLTGRYWSRFGNTAPSNLRVLPWGTPTLASLLKSAGYRTGISGKWHLGSKPAWGPKQFGFDQTYGSLAGGVNPWTHLYKTGAYSKSWHRNDQLIDEEGHATDLITREAVEFIGNKDESTPFFMYVPFTAVHTPFDEPEPYLARCEHISDQRRQYAASCVHLDESIGKIIDALEKTDQRDNTVIIFLSDNGGTNGDDSKAYPDTQRTTLIQGLNKPLRGWKKQLWEGGIRVPALINWPGRLAPGRVEEAIHVTDWLPTLASMIGHKTDPANPIDGVDLWPLFTGQRAPVAWDTRTLYSLGVQAKSASLHHGPWKLIVNNAPNGKHQLFNLQQDPTEKNDVADQNSPIVEDLLERLERASQLDNAALPNRENDDKKPSSVPAGQ